LKGHKTRFGKAVRPCLKERKKRGNFPGPASYKLSKPFGSERGFYYSKKLETV